MNKSFYSIPRSKSQGNEFGDYCNYCALHFKVFNPLIRNICQSCGRVAQQIVKDKQPEELLTAINDPATSNSNSLKAVSQDIDYTPLFTNDETKEGIASGNVVKQAKSLSEAIQWLHMMDSSSRSIKMQNKIKYRITTTGGGKRNNKRNRSGEDVMIEEGQTKRKP